MQKRRNRWEEYVDFILIPPVIFFSTYVPRFASGLLMSVDEGQHLAAVDALARGSIPFRDIYFMHGPLLEYFLYWTMKLFGFQLSVARGFYLFGNIIFLLLVFILLRTLISNWVLKYATLFFILRYPMFFVWITRYGGVRFLPGVGVLFLLYFWLYRSKRLYLFLAGLVCGLGLLISQEIGLSASFAATLVIFLRSLEHRADGRCAGEILRNGSLLFFGFTVAVLPIYSYLILHGAFVDYLKIEFIDTVFLLPKRIQYSLPLLSVADLLLFPPLGEEIVDRSWAFYSIVVAYGVIIMWALFEHKKMSRTRMILLLMMMGYSGLLLKGATRCLVGPQFNVALPFVFITVSLFLNIVLDPSANGGEIGDPPPYEASASRLGQWTNPCLLVAIVAAIALSGNPYAFFRANLAKLWMVPSGHNEMNPNLVPRAKGSKIPLKHAADIEGVVKFLREHTNENDQIYTFPSEGHINFLANRPSASRFVIALCSRVRDEYMREVVETLEAKQTKYIVYFPGGYRLMNIPDEKRLEPIWLYIRINYKVLRQFNETRILVRVSPPEGVAKLPDGEAGSD